MLSYIGKVIFLLFFLYTLLVPYTITNSFAEGDRTTERHTRKADENNNIGVQVNISDKKYWNSDTHINNGVKENNYTSDADVQNVIAKNLQLAGNFLSSSPSELAEQAKSYALGQVNGLVTSEAQKWLSQFGTARINFAIDNEGKLKNSSLDLLLPLYDNKADWLFFSQLGYRNKDSRNTMNLGLGGRYFYEDWMYGLNTFYDYDLTGKNQRLGLGGELWRDYVKVSANTYYRVSDWKNSRDFAGYHERTANGYDIRGEFFLPAYPNLGVKLSYEQYFGDQVTLFDRDTKQKDPNLAIMGLSYTPVPLFTLGVDYKQAAGGHSEAQFLANLSYKLGVPLSAQLSSENVALARQLAGSRYDLVERNNHIVLDHQAKPAAQLSLPDTVIGYSGNQQDVTVKFSSDSPAKQIRWETKPDFEKNGGKLSSQFGNTIKVTLPTYLPGDNQNNSYPISAFAEWENGQKSAPAEMRVIVKPFMLKKLEEANFTPAGPLLATGEAKDGYTFDPVITFDTADGAPIKNATINHVQWITDPKVGPDTGLELLGLGTSDSAAIDENGHFKHKPILVSKEPHKNVKVYLKMDSQAPQLVGEVGFDINIDGFHFEKIEVSPATPSLIANGSQTYTYKAVVLDGNNKPIGNQKINNVNWSIKQNGKDMSTTAPNITFTTSGDTTTPDGELTAKLSSKEEMKDVVVSLSIQGKAAVPAQNKVTFVKDTQDYSISKDGIKPEKLTSLTADGYQQYQFMATILDISGKPVDADTVINDAHWKIDEPSDAAKYGITLTSETKTDGKGNLKAILSSTQEFTGDVVVSLSVHGKTAASAKTNVAFIAHSISKNGIKSEELTSLSANGYQQYQFMATILDANGSPVKAGTVIKDALWQIDKPTDAAKSGLTLTPENKTDSKGNLKVILSSTQAFTGDVVVSLKVGTQGPVQSTDTPVEFGISGIIPPTMTMNTLTSASPDGSQQYQFTVSAQDAKGNPIKSGTVVHDAVWKIEKISGIDESAVKLTPDNTVDKDGNLSAILTSVNTLGSTDDLNGSIDVSLTIGTQSPVSLTGSLIEFKPGSISIVTMTPSIPLVVYGYTNLQVIVRDGQGRGFANKTVKWNISVNQGGDLSAAVIAPTSSTTNNDGKATTTLASIKPQIVTVTVSVDDIGDSQPTSMTFELPGVTGYNHTHNQSNTEAQFSVKLLDTLGHPFKENYNIPFKAWLIGAAKDAKGNLETYKPIDSTRFEVKMTKDGNHAEGLEINVTDTQSKAISSGESLHILACFGIGDSVREAQDQVIHCDEHDDVNAWIVSP
ncbi:inverse autotransporter beta domain-containing protein [Xenorhabdus ishibashii]|uniref:Putative Bacterial Ig-like domain n=1 Tax=Xenorhabdus ishibashii TaxID=1034471 RepID=A0A2D0KF32_9GAMM|nr:inverse autotransporter beta domain-containing protein [Xenorhabdus ishibashii]PHM62053.1 putative Bacterial Ig-like domain [Xenorhabdus ishibashii]